MGDIFRREIAAHPEPFTGERLTTAIAGQIQIEHYHRYLFARSLVGGMDVLDVASGEGYGSALLSQVARSVVGTEYADGTTRTAAGNFRRPNLSFLRADARALPLADGAVDAVVSFETIEHIDRQDDFLREIRRVLRPDGLLIVSTPDRDVYSPAGTAANPYHVRELTEAEFLGLLRTAFPQVQLVRQRALMGSALLTDVAFPSPPLTFERRGETHFEASNGLPRAPYLVAIASARELPPLRASLLIDRGDLDTDTLRILALSNQLQQAQSELTNALQGAAAAEQARDLLHAQHQQLAEQYGRLNEQHDRLNEQHGRLNEQHGRLNEQYGQLNNQHGLLMNQHEQLKGSLRGFLRGYLPRLRQHLFGARG